MISWLRDDDEFDAILNALWSGRNRRTDVIFDERHLDHTCALAEATDLAMKAYAADRGWGDYDFEDDSEGLRNLLGPVLEALAEDGWLDLDRYLAPAHEE